ncbi:MAG: hypothetical protein GXP10_02300 [Gammaproteobacteria bacterium]|nr:hypothetical protein [Gammaproteobacteria bacterium]
MMQHNWTLVGPWYRETSLGGAPPPRSQRPIIQKYAADNFADAFIKEPQLSLRFTCEDFSNNSCSDPFIPVASTADGEGRHRGALKLFHGAHSRFYVVTCELHCDAAGFPSVAREQVCEAGFVVRKRASSLPYVAQQEMAPLFVERRKLERVVQRLTQRMSPKRRKGVRAIIGHRLDSARAEKIAELDCAIARVDAQIHVLSIRYGINPSLQGWVPSEVDGVCQQEVGAWIDVEQQPQVIEEEIFPLYPVIPAPNDAQHSAQGKTMWFGVVPTQSSAVDGSAAPRFDDETHYEIHCFVRQHKSNCPKKSSRADCHGEVVWSEPTENYRIASFFDLDGCGNRPINIRLPDLNALKEQVARGPVGKGASVRLSTPPDSSVVITTNNFEMPSSGGSPGDGKICFFAIPLITIVAMFLLQIVLPIVVFLFNLWFLLSLRLCIPPGISFDADFAADLKLLGPSFKLGLEASFSAEFLIGGRLIENYADLGDAFNDLFDTDNKLDPKFKQALVDKIKAGDSDIDTILQAAIDMTADYSDQPEDERLAASLPDVSAGIRYFDKVEAT